MKLWSDSFANGQAIPSTFAFGKHHPETHVELCENRNPHLAWSDLPAGAKSLVLICHDSDVPSSPENVNREGVTVPADLPRVTLLDVGKWSPRFEQAICQRAIIRCHPRAGEWG